jgi:membrane protein YqaA with SNARE-associated domain
MLEGLEHLGYIGLFIASILGATVLPFGAEVVFGILVVKGLDLWILIIVATIGNTVGGMICFWLGSLGKIETVEKYTRIKHERVEKMQNWLHGRGAFMCVFAGVPGVGDVVAIALGLMRAKVWLVLLFMASGKFVRFTVVGCGFAKIFGAL